MLVLVLVLVLAFRTTPVVHCFLLILSVLWLPCSQQPPVLALVEVKSMQCGLASQALQHSARDIGFEYFWTVSPCTFTPCCRCTLAPQLPGGDGGPGGAGGVGPGGPGGGGPGSGGPGGGVGTLELKGEDQLKNLPAGVAISLYRPLRSTPSCFEFWVLELGA